MKESRGPAFDKKYPRQLLGLAATMFLAGCGTIGAYYGEQWTSDVYKSIAGSP